MPLKKNPTMVSSSPAVDETHDGQLTMTPGLAVAAHMQQVVPHLLQRRVSIHPQPHSQPGYPAGCAFSTGACGIFAATCYTLRAHPLLW